MLNSNKIKGGGYTWVWNHHSGNVSTPTTPRSCKCPMLPQLCLRCLSTLRWKRTPNINPTESPFCTILSIYTSNPGEDGYMYPFADSSYPSLYTTVSDPLWGQCMSNSILIVAPLYYLKQRKRATVYARMELFPCSSRVWLLFIYQLDCPLAIVAAHPTSHICPQLQPLAALGAHAKSKELHGNVL
jgi:hypothetical protein